MAPMTSSPANSPLIVFDLDGTLIDTAPDLIGTLNVILRREGLAPVPVEVARNMIGSGARSLIERGLLAEGRRAPETELKRMVADFIVHYGDNIALASKPFEGLVEALDELTSRGMRLAVCTNKLEWLSVKLLKELGLADRFVTICGADTFGVAKPNPAILEKTVARAGGHAALAIMVGDAATDVNAARAARIPVIGVDFGYSETPIVELKPDRVISHMRDLPGAVAALLEMAQHRQR
jgi:phosphoglycolate phosphatase